MTDNLGQTLQLITVVAELRKLIQTWVADKTPVQDIYKALADTFTLTELITLSQFATVSGSQADAIIHVAMKRAYRKAKAA